jgi:hypothetical protein
MHVNLQAVGLLPMWMMILSRAPLMILVSLSSCLSSCFCPMSLSLIGSLWVPLWGAIYVCMYYFIYRLFLWLLGSDILTCVHSCAIHHCMYVRSFISCTVLFMLRRYVDNCCYIWSSAVSEWVRVFSWLFILVSHIRIMFFCGMHS